MPTATYGHQETWQVTNCSPKIESWALNSSAVTLCNYAGYTLQSTMSLNMKCNPKERACAPGFALISLTVLIHPVLLLHCWAPNPRLSPAQAAVVQVKENLNLCTHICIHTHTHTYIPIQNIVSKSGLNIFDTKKQFLISISHLSMT